MKRIILIIDEMKKRSEQKKRIDETRRGSETKSMCEKGGERKAVREKMRKGEREPIKRIRRVRIHKKGG